MKYIFILIFSIGLNVLSAQSNPKLYEVIEKLVRLELQINYKKTPGFLVGVVEGDSTYVYAFGTAEKEGNNTHENNHIFEIGSVTKIFTASLLQKMANDGLLSLDDPLGKYIEINNENKNIALRELVTHTSGLPRLPMDFGTKEIKKNNPYAFYTKNDLIKFISTYKVQEDKKSKYQYSHIGFALLELVIESVSHESYSSLLQKEILDPMELNNTTFQLDDAQEKRLSKGYSLGGNEVKPWLYQSFEGALGLKSDMNDLLKFLKYQLNPSSTHLSRVIDQMREKQVESGIKRVSIGTGWHIVHHKKFYDMFAHSGATDGHRAYMAFVKETQTGVVVLSNSENNMGGLGALVLQLINYNWNKKKMDKRLGLK